MKTQQAAQLLKEKTHAIIDDNGDFDTLRKVLKLAFPDDYETDDYDFLENCNYGYSEFGKGKWCDNGDYLSELIQIKLSEIKESHYDNTNGSIYKFCEDQKLNPWEFDIIKRIVRSRRKGQFVEDLEKTKVLIDLYLKEYGDAK